MSLTRCHCCNLECGPGPHAVIVLLQAAKPLKACSLGTLVLAASWSELCELLANLQPVELENPCSPTPASAIMQALPIVGVEDECCHPIEEWQYAHVPLRSHER